jgi:hypothetical protein
MRLEDSPLCSLESRARARALLDMTTPRIQVVVSSDELDPALQEPLDLAACTVDRQQTAEALIEIITLNGKLEEISERDLMAFVNAHPITRRGTRYAGRQS